MTLLLQRQRISRLGHEGPARPCGLVRREFSVQPFEAETKRSEPRNGMLNFSISGRYNQAILTPEPSHMLITHSITSSDFRSRLDQLTATRADLEALLYLIGPDKMLEWAHTIGVATEAELAALAPPMPPVEMRIRVAAQSEPVFLWSGLAATCAGHILANRASRNERRSCHVER